MDSESDPFQLFERWFAEAASHPEIDDATAMSLATADGNGRPAVRIVLLKRFDANGVYFVTNYESSKSHDLMANPQAALCFYWPPLGKQVRIEGMARQADAAFSDAYFAGRPREKQVGAWTSRQSAPLESREQFEVELAATTARFTGQPIPRPPHWGGWQIIPHRFEFWQQGDHRWHARLVFAKHGEDWEKGLLYP